jgi:hypothetical protein
MCLARFFDAAEAAMLVQPIGAMSPHEAGWIWIGY